MFETILKPHDYELCLFTALINTVKLTPIMFMVICTVILATAVILGTVSIFTGISLTASFYFISNILLTISFPISIAFRFVQEAIDNF